MKGRGGDEAEAARPDAGEGNPGATPRGGESRGREADRENDDGEAATGGQRQRRPRAGASTQEAARGRGRRGHAGRAGGRDEPDEARAGTGGGDGGDERGGAAGERGATHAERRSPEDGRGRGGTTHEGISARSAANRDAASRAQDRAHDAGDESTGGRGERPRTAETDKSHKHHPQGTPTPPEPPAAGAGAETPAGETGNRERRTRRPRKGKLVLGKKVCGATLQGGHRADFFADPCGDDGRR